MNNHSWDVRGIPVTGVSNGMAGDLVSTKRTGGCLPSAASGLLIALVIQIPAVTTMVWGNGRSGSRASRSQIDQNCVLIGAHIITIIKYLGQDICAGEERERVRAFQFQIRSAHTRTLYFVGMAPAWVGELKAYYCDKPYFEEDRAATLSSYLSRSRAL